MLTRNRSPRACPCAAETHRPAGYRRARWIGLVAVLLVASAVPSAREAVAQRPFLVHDPFYRSETARRGFYDGFALSGEVAYRPAGPFQDDGLPSPGIDPLGLSFRLDYELASRLDLSAMLDASGGRSGRTLSLSWLVLTYYEYVDGTDHSLRLAVDPTPDGLVGFPQADLAFITSAPLSPRFATDIALGARRVRLGYERWVRGPEMDPASGAAPAAMVATMAASSAPAGVEVVFTRVLGWEAHFMNSYKWRFDPAGSNLFVSMLAEGGEYELLETERAEPDNALEDGAAAERSFTTTLQAGVVWARMGVEYNRPSYQVAPFIGFPIGQWTSARNEALRARLNAGLRLMIR